MWVGPPSELLTQKLWAQNQVVPGQVLGGTNLPTGMRAWTDPELRAC